MVIPVPRFTTMYARYSAILEDARLDADNGEIPKRQEDEAEDQAETTNLMAIKFEEALAKCKADAGLVVNKIGISLKVCI